MRINERLEKLENKVVYDHCGCGALVLTLIPEFDATPEEIDRERERLTDVGDCRKCGLPRVVQLIEVTWTSTPLPA